jgi:hypothetical protein
VIDTGSRKVVYREESPGVFDGVEVRLGPRMNGPGDAPFYPVIDGLKPGERIVTTGSFLIDAETRLNPAAGSIYYGGGGSGNAPAGAVRPSATGDKESGIKAALAKLSAEDQRLASNQRLCAILGSKLGSMGTPVKVVIEGEPVFLCCKGCKEEALAHPEKTLARARELRAKSAGESGMKP